MLTWLKLGWEECRLWVRSEWLDTVHVESGLFCEKERQWSQENITSRPKQQSCASGTKDQLATCSANLLGELSAVSLAELQGSKCSCWPGNLRRSISHSSCSWSPPRRCDLFPSRRFLGDLDECSLCLEALGDSDIWPSGAEGRNMALSGTARGLDGGLVSEFSILQSRNINTGFGWFLIKISQTWVKFTSDNTGIRWLVLVQ